MLCKLRISNHEVAFVHAGFASKANGPKIATVDPANDASTPVTSADLPVTGAKLPLRRVIRNTHFHNCGNVIGFKPNAMPRKGEAS